MKTDRRRPDWRPVDAGNRVACPRRGEDVDIQHCLECNWLLELDRSGRAALRCAASSPTLTTPDSYLRPQHVD